MSDRIITEVPTSANPLVLVNEMTLLFHRNVFREFEVNAWLNRLKAIYAPHGRGVPCYEATNRVLCEAIRVALDDYDEMIRTASPSNFEAQNSSLAVDRGNSRDAAVNAAGSVSELCAPPNASAPKIVSERLSSPYKCPFSGVRAKAWENLVGCGAYTPEEAEALIKDTPLNDIHKLIGKKHPRWHTIKEAAQQTKADQILIDHLVNENKSLKDMAQRWQSCAIELHGKLEEALGRRRTDIVVPPGVQLNPDWLKLGPQANMVVPEFATKKCRYCERARSEHCPGSMRCPVYTCGRLTGWHERTRFTARVPEFFTPKPGGVKRDWPVIPPTEMCSHGILLSNPCGQCEKENL